MFLQYLRWFMIFRCFHHHLLIAVFSFLEPLVVMDTHQRSQMFKHQTQLLKQKIYQNKTENVHVPTWLRRPHERRFEPCWRRTSGADTHCMVCGNSIPPHHHHHPSAVPHHMNELMLLISLLHNALWLWDNNQRLQASYPHRILAHRKWDMCMNRRAAVWIIKSMHNTIGTQQVSFSPTQLRFTLFKVQF